METFRNNKIPKNPSQYLCTKCNYSTHIKKDYNKHLLTSKHRMETNGNEKLQLKYNCDNCSKVFNSRSGLWKHGKKCHVINTETVEDTPIQPQLQDSNLIVELLKQNKELHEMVIDLAKNSGNTTNNTTNNNNNTTNNSFNLNVFLNETCKDAMNLNDFIQSIELNINDFINTGEVGYVKGISNIMVERIRDMEPHIRPIHCTDLKRETVYVKDSDKWAKEDENKTHIRKAVRIVADKNQAQVHPWIKENPKYEILDTPECDKYFEYTKASLGGYGREEDKKFENKIINNILKETVIDKKMIT